MQNPSGAVSVRCVFTRGPATAYYAQRGNLYVVLCGGDKSTQSKDIERAKTILSDLKAMKE